MRKAREVLQYLKRIEGEIIKNFNMSDLQKERLFYEARFIFLRDLIKDLEKRIDD